MHKTIASLALLKVNWDNGARNDFIENFVPFVATLFNRKNYAVVNTNTVCRDFESEFGLSIPYHPMITLLERARRTGYITKKRNGDFAPVKGRVVENDFTDVALEQERKYKHILDSFQEYCRNVYEEVLTQDEAETALISFLGDHDLDMLFASASPTTILPTAHASTAQKYLMNSFVRHVYESLPELFAFVVDISLGHIIANTLLYRDIEKYQNGLQGCCFYLDTGLLFNIMGINGPEKQDAYVKFIRLLGDHGAHCLVFHHTHEEFKGILETCLTRVENGSYYPLKTSPALRYFLDNEYAASDVELFILGVPKHLSDLSIEIIDVPDPQVAQEHQIDELDLSDVIVNTYTATDPYFDQTEREYTLLKDVKSISAIYKLRAGHRPGRLQEAKHVFVTTNASLARASRVFELKNTQSCCFFIPAALTDVFVGTLVWIQSPARVNEVNEKRMIANCYAALQPSKTMMKQLIDAAERLKHDGTITEQDVTLLKQSRVARNLLQEETLGDPNRFSDKTVTEILDEIRAGIRKEEQHALEQDRRVIETQATQWQQEVENARQLRQAAVDEGEQTRAQLEDALREKASLEASIDLLAERTAGVVTTAFHMVSIVVVLLTTVVQFVPNLFQVGSVVRWILLAVAAILTIANLITGFNILGAGRSLRNWVKSRVANRLKSRT